MGKFFDDEIDKSTVVWLGTVAVGTVFVYVSSALNQIPNVPENANLSRNYYSAYNNDYLRKIQSNNFINCTEKEILNELVEVMSAMNKNTTHLKLNYKQVLSNRFKEFNFTPERIKAIQSNQAKNVTKNELQHLMQISAIYDVYQFLSAQSSVRLGLQENLSVTEEIDQNNRYLLSLNGCRSTLMNDTNQLMNLAEKSFVEFIKQCNVEKSQNCLEPEVVFVDGATGEIDQEWQVQTRVKKLPREMFGHTELRKCLVMEFDTQKAFNAFLGHLSARGVDVDKLISKAQQIIIQQMEREAKENQTRNLPLHQTAGKPAITETVTIKEKKSRLINNFKIKKINKFEQDKSIEK